jgi:hypothetical protein
VEPAPERRASPQHLGELLARHRRLPASAIGASIGFAFGLANGLSQQRSERVFDSTLWMVRNISSRADSAGDPLVRHR